MKWKPKKTKITFTFPIGTCDPSQFLNLRFEFAGGIGGSVQLTPINQTKFLEKQY